ncbi:MAG: hypothetical protein AAF624_16470 [Bacteroidota bacterium]
MVAGDNQARTWHDVEVAWVASETGLTDPLAEIVLGGVAVVASEADRQALVNAIRKNSGDPVIDWKGQQGATGS